jgi:hypothetical protein
MSDEDKKTEKTETPRSRPNAGYQLSKKTAGDEQLTFYYDRERRLAKAPQVVRDLYKEEPPVKRFGLFRSLVSTKPRAMMFGSIMMICAAMMILSLFGYTGDTYELEGNRISVQAERYEGALMVALKKTVKKSGEGPDHAYTGAVDLAAAPAARSGEDTPVFYHRIFFSRDPVEEYRFSVPFDSNELVLVIKTEKKTLNVTLKSREMP